MLWFNIILYLILNHWKTYYYLILSQLTEFNKTTEWKTLLLHFLTADISVSDRERGRNKITKFQIHKIFRLQY